jgi:two-component system sensor histidine kinase ChiS
MTARAAILPVLAALLSIYACAPATSVGQAKEGKIDLFHINFDEIKVLELSGEWEYYPNRIIAPSELTSYAQSRAMVYLPYFFNRHSQPGVVLPAGACATYRLELLLPPRLAVYSLRVPPLENASRIYINGQLVAQQGVVAQDPKDVKPAAKTQYIQAPLAGRTELVIQVANSEYFRGGITQSLVFGSGKKMEQYRLKAVARDVVIIVALLSFAIYHFLFVFLGHPERASGYYGAFCLTIGLGQLLRGETLIADILPSLPWALRIRCQEMLVYLAAVFFTSYLRQFFAPQARSKAVSSLILVSLLFSLAAAVLPIEPLSQLRTPYEVIVTIHLPFGVLLLYRLVRQNVFGAKLLLLTIVLLGVAFVSDSLRRAGLHSGPTLFPYVTLGFTFMQAILLSAKSLRLFQENAELTRRLTHIDKLRDEFLEHTSHELRTPVQAMVQTIENVRRGLSGAVSEQVQRTLAVVEESGERLMYLIDDLRDFIRLKHSDLRLNLQTVSLRKVIEPVLKLGLGLTENRQFALIDEIPEGLEDVKVDPVRVQQILLNLLNTAIRYSHSPTITVKVGKLDGQLAIIVSYSGAEPDRRYREPLDSGSEDVGPLVTQKLAELMGGKYVYRKFAESQHALIITLPYEHIDSLDDILASSRAHTEYRKSDASQALPMRNGVAANRSTGEKLLLVGDHAGQNRLLQEQLASLNRVITIAKNGAEAMLKLQNEQGIALVICDLLLADVSGIELTKNIRTQFDIGQLPVILIIDNNQAAIAASAFAAGVNDVMRRPLEKAEVVARVRNLLLQREANLARENYRALERELEIARSIQESIIPTSQPHSNQCKIEAVCIPARSIGGDFYDFLEEENIVGILIADVAGHGIPAALYAAMLKIAFHNLRDRARYPERLLKDLNEMMIDRGERTFISCAYTLLDFQNRRLLHANAGHLPLLLQEPGKKTVRRIQPPGGVLGVRKAAAITVEMHHLEPQTRLVLFTDGVVELANKKGQFFDEEGLVSILEELRDKPLGTVKEQLLTALREFTEAEQFLDDVTFVLLEV